MPATSSGGSASFEFIPGTFTALLVTTSSAYTGDLSNKTLTDMVSWSNTGDFYDNRDGDHSPLSLAPWPQMSAFKYSQEDIKLNGCALECRINAEDPFRNFLPSVGRLVKYMPAEEVEGQVRVDTGVYEGGLSSGRSRPAKKPTAPRSISPSTV